MLSCTENSGLAMDRSASDPSQPLTPTAKPEGWGEGAVWMAGGGGIMRITCLEKTKVCVSNLLSILFIFWFNL